MASREDTRRSIQAQRNPGSGMGGAIQRRLEQRRGENRGLQRDVRGNRNASGRPLPNRTAPGEISDIGLQAGGGFGFGPLNPSGAVGTYPDESGYQVPPNMPNTGMTPRPLPNRGLEIMGRTYPNSPEFLAQLLESIRRGVG